MKKITGLLLIISVYSFTSSFCQQSEPIIIKANLQAKQGIPLTYLDEHGVERGLLLKNTTNHDTLITGIIISKHPIELQKRVYLNGRGIKQSFLVKRGDIVNLRVSNEHMSELNDNKSFPQDYLAYIDPFKRTVMKPFEQYTDDELKSYYNECAKIYKSNSSKIDSLKEVKHISVEDINFFVRMNQIEHYIRIMEPVIRPGMYQRVLNKFIKETEVDQIRVFTHTFNDYKTVELNNLTSLLIDYDLYKHKISPTDLPKVVDFILTLKYGDRGSNLAFHKISYYQDKTSAFIPQALNVLATKTYAEQLPDINTALTDYQNRNKNFIHPENVKLARVDGTSTNLSQIYEANKGKLVLLDFWASWCIPCRQQIPIIKQLEEKYKNKKIRFVSISLDFDKARAQWLTALKQDGNFVATNQYRLINDQQSGFTKFYKVTSIPRYMLIGTDGKVIESNFYNPVEKQFESTLIGELAKLGE